MSLSGQTDGQLYRLIITRRNASETLLVPRGSGWLLPHLQVGRARRLAEQLTQGTRRKWKIESYCLFAGNWPGTVDDAPAGNYAVMESLAQNAQAPPGAFWMTSRATTRQGVLPAEDHLATSEALGQLQQYSGERDAAPLAKPGWLRELFGWVEQQVKPLGLRLTGGFRQLNAAPSFSLMRLETDGPAVWFKATGEPHRRELGIVTTLALEFPGYVPEIWGVHSLWNGWLAPEIPGSKTLDAFAHASPWARAAKRLAELQIASLDKTSELLNSGCADRRINKLGRQVDAFIARMKKAMAAQEQSHPPRLTNAELDWLGDQLLNACSTVAALGLPDALGHIDFNPGNILVSGASCWFLDWAEGCVANPLITFEYLCEHFRRQRLGAPGARRRIISSYLEPWPPPLSSALEEGMAASPLLAVFAYATSGSTCNGREVAGNRNLDGYLRSLTRRMHREALRLMERNQPCLD